MRRILNVDLVLRVALIAVSAVLVVVWGMVAVTLSRVEAAAEDKGPSAQQALQVLEQASGDYKGTRRDHVAIQDALRTLSAQAAGYAAYVQVIGKGGVVTMPAVVQVEKP